MASNRNSLAYDMSLFDETVVPAKKEITAEIAKNVTDIASARTQKRSKATAFRNIVATVFCAALAIFLIYSNAQVTEMVYNIKQEQANLGELKDEVKRLNVEIEKKFDLRTIEQTAREEYGMQKLSADQMTYIASDSVSHALLVQESEESIMDSLVRNITAAVTSVQAYFNR